MKKICLFIILSFILFSCKKKIDNPTPTPSNPVTSEDSLHWSQLQQQWTLYDGYRITVTTKPDNNDSVNYFRYPATFPLYYNNVFNIKMDTIYTEIYAGYSGTWTQIKTNKFFVQIPSGYTDSIPFNKTVGTYPSSSPCSNLILNPNQSPTNFTILKLTNEWLVVEIPSQYFPGSNHDKFFSILIFHNSNGTGFLSPSLSDFCRTSQCSQIGSVFNKICHFTNLGGGVQSITMSGEVGAYTPTLFGQSTQIITGKWLFSQYQYFQDNGGNLQSFGDPVTVNDTITFINQYQYSYGGKVYQYSMFNESGGGVGFDLINFPEIGTIRIDNMSTLFTVFNPQSIYELFNYDRSHGTTVCKVLLTKIN